MPDVIKIWIPGTVQPGGSKRIVVNHRTGRGMITDDCRKNADWKSAVATHARFAYRAKPLEGSLIVTCLIVIERPKWHFGTGKNATRLKLGVPMFPNKKPDATKLWRSTEDALTGILWIDDALIVDQRIVKGYCGGINLLSDSGHCPDYPGAFVTVRNA